MVAHGNGVAGDPSEVSDAVVALVETPNGKRPRRTVVAPAAQRMVLEAFNHTADTTATAVLGEMGVSAFAAPR
ncbi:hypothetical protein [Actinoplanes sp. NPDC026619]|uniref:hypothetical protein n=1 Tax=Actinoplanes sp. NPDC026619 TaxID=3155798 RepID=UPI0033E975A3